MTTVIKMEKWEIKSIVVIIISILVICSIIWYSYYLTGQRNRMSNFNNVESFKSYADLQNELNSTRQALLDIKSVQQQKLLNINPDVNSIDPEQVFSPELQNRLDRNFDIRFSQKLQDTEIVDLQSQLDILKQKMSKLPPAPTNYMLKSLGGSSFAMLGDSSEFSLKTSPNSAMCLGFNRYGLNNPNEKDNVYYTSDARQCDKGDSDKYQKFKLTEIRNNSDFNKMAGPAYEVPEYYNLNNYPFYIAQPIEGTLRQDGTLSECITFDNSGLSVEPCNGNESQRWHIYSVN